MCKKLYLLCVQSAHYSHFCSDANKVKISFHISHSWLFFWVHWPAVSDTFLCGLGCIRLQVIAYCLPHINDDTFKTKCLYSCYNASQKMCIFPTCYLILINLLYLVLYSYNNKFKLLFRPIKMSTKYYSCMKSYYILE